MSRQMTRKWENCTAAGVRGSAITKKYGDAIWSCVCRSERCTLTSSHPVFPKVIRKKYYANSFQIFSLREHTLHSFIWKWRSSAFLLNVSHKSRPRETRSGVNGPCSVTQRSARVCSQAPITFHEPCEWQVWCEKDICCQYQGQQGHRGRTSLRSGPNGSS